MGNIAARNRVRFNPFSDEFRCNPYAMYKRLRSEDPFHRAMGTWVLTRYRDVAAVLRDRRFSSMLFPEMVKRNKPDMGDLGQDPIEAFVAKAIVFTENPDHARLRQLVNPAFNPQAIQLERPLIERIADELLQQGLARGHFDGIAEFADPLPLYVTAERIGLPREIFPDIRNWTHQIRQLLDPGLMTKDDYRRVYDALHPFMETLRKMLPERRAKPGHDLMSQLLISRHRDDKLTDDEVILTCIMSFVAGTETTKFLVGNGILALLQHPDQAQLLRSNPRLMSSAVNEVLRFDAPLQQTKRVALEDVSLGEVTVKEGEQVLLCLGAANRDPEQFDQPDCFNIARNSNNTHLGFGHGMRTCLGGGMASLEAEVAFQKLFLSGVQIQLASTDLHWQQESRILRGLTDLSLRVLSAPPQTGYTRALS